MKSKQSQLRCEVGLPYPFPQMVINTPRTLSTEPRTKEKDSKTISFFFKKWPRHDNLFFAHSELYPVFSVPRHSLNTTQQNNTSCTVEDLGNRFDRSRHHFLNTSTWIQQQGVSQDSWWSISYSEFCQMYYGTLCNFYSTVYIYIYIYIYWLLNYQI